MKFVYAPKDGQRHEWPFEPGDLLNVEAAAIKKLTGMSFGEWAKAMQDGDPDAYHGFIWVMQKRESPTLRSTDVQFRVGECSFDFDDEEVEAILRGIAKEPDSPEVQDVIRLLEMQGVDVKARVSEIAAESAEVDEDPKDLAE